MAERDETSTEQPLGRFGVRCLFQHGDDLYEERITLWLARDEAHAFELAEMEAEAYCEALGDGRTPVRFLHFSQSYRLDDDPAQQGAEVFSLMRDSGLAAGDYIDRFFDTGEEHEGPV